MVLQRVPPGSDHNTGFATQGGGAAYRPRHYATNSPSRQGEQQLSGRSTAAAHTDASYAQAWEGTPMPTTTIMAIVQTCYSSMVQCRQQPATQAHPTRPKAATKHTNLPLHNVAGA